MTGFASFQFESNVQVDVVAPPSNIVISSDLSVTAPAELTLNCSADGIPKPTLTWTRVSDGTVVTMPLNITGGMDGGGYRCTADNGVGKLLTKDVFVDVQVPPMVKLPSKVFVGREQSASLICEVEGNPTPIISWSPCSGRSVVCDEQYLNISKVQTGCANYTCTARNAVGVDSETTLLLIGGKNVFLRLNMTGECDNKDSVWEMLQKEVLYNITWKWGYSQVQGAYAQSGPPAANGADDAAEQEVGAPAIPTYAVVDQPKKLREEVPTGHTEVDKSKKKKTLDEPKKEKKPGELLYAGLADFQNPGMPTVCISPQPVPSIKKADPQERTDYQDIPNSLGDMPLDLKAMVMETGK
ncbi:PREDICTED: neural cell adhesion molecule 2-like [Acropora digitifera]|uniref:neural cell adhesion molecule 2-like n=1 Tax=Acropora digitifera TaxID=70779 RepID=UPI00077A2105|nr:PREDICTED: neural cell adhesion molecule 2-like [Acropora digitifera]